jgi:hypothetical protein
LINDLSIQGLFRLVDKKQTKKTTINLDNSHIRIGNALQVVLYELFLLLFGFIIKKTNVIQVKKDYTGIYIWLQNHLFVNGQVQYSLIMRSQFNILFSYICIRYLRRKMQNLLKRVYQM